MDKALEEERYAEAAMLRDAGGVGLLGWWAGRSEGDSTGHVVRGTPEFGRYVAAAYTARELADAAVGGRDASVGPRPVEVVLWVQGTAVTRAGWLAGCRCTCCVLAS